VDRNGIEWGKSLTLKKTALGKPKLNPGKGGEAKGKGGKRKKSAKVGGRGWVLLGGGGAKEQRLPERKQLNQQ